MYYLCMKNENVKIESLFRQHYRQMHRLATLLLHDDAESKDVVHDVFAQLMDSPDRRLDGDTAAAFLLTCVRNRCLNVIRSRKIHERVQRLYLLNIDTTVIPADFLKEELKALAEGITLLSPPACRQVVEMHFNEGLSFRETALKLGVSETTVYKYLRSALNQLRTHIKKD